MDRPSVVAGLIEQQHAASRPEKSECPPSGMADIMSAPGPDIGRRASAPARLNRLRRGRACITCHTRKVRCDAASLGIPCTNCSAFSLECVVPEKNRKKKARKHMDNLRQQSDISIPDMGSVEGAPKIVMDESQPVIVSEPSQNMYSASLTGSQPDQQPEDIKYYAKFIKQEVTEEPIKEAGRVAYLEESSNLSLLINDYNGPFGVVHYPMQGNTEIGHSGSAKLDKVELAILRRRGALFLPSKTVSDDLVKTYFKWVAPIMPIINKTRFMQQYRDPNNPPSLLLLQAVFLAGCRACTNAQLIDSNGSTIPSATIFYKRAKALYESNYDDDRVAIVQALILMGWYWEDPGKVTKNVFYWNGLAVTIAQGCGMHRNAEQSRLSRTDKRLWKRIWWTLFTRDRSVAVALGRPPHIHMDDSDVEMLTEDDFIDIDNDTAQLTSSIPGRLQVQFFLQYVKLSQVIDLVLLQNYSTASKARRGSALALTQCDMALADWLQACPHELRWERSRHHFWSALLFSVYHTTSCLLHRTYLPSAPSHREVWRKTQLNHSTLPSRNPAFQAAHAITSIMETLSDHKELSFSPPFMIYSLSSALLIHVYQLHVAMPITDVVIQNRIRACISCLEQISKVWLVARMTQNLFEFILTEKGIGDFLQDGPGKIDTKGEDLLGGKSHNAAQHRNQGTEADSSEKFRERLKAQSPALTPALLAHLFAALKSGTSSSSSENGDVPKESAPTSNTTRYEYPLPPKSRAQAEGYNSEPHTRNLLPTSHQIIPDPTREQRLTEEAPANASQYPPHQIPEDSNSIMYTVPQTMNNTNPVVLAPSQYLPLDRHYMQNVAGRPQVYPNEVTDLHQSHRSTELSYFTTEADYMSLNTTTTRPPAPLGPNVLEWIQYFGIGNAP